MREKHNNNVIRRIVDLCMSLLLLCLMAYQVTGEMVHEWVGVAMTALVIVHQILNRRWYKSIFKGKYNPYRILTTAVNILLLLSFALTAFSGMSMSGHAVPFLYGMTPASFARQTHLAMSHWAFVLMGIHLGLHVPVMAAQMNIKDSVRKILAVIFCVIAGIGLFLFLGNGMTDYMFFRVPFAFLDYDKPGALVFLENLLQLTTWAFVGDQVGAICRKSARKNAQDNEEGEHENKNRLMPLVLIMAAAVIGLALNTALPADRDAAENDGWNKQENSEVKDQTKENSTGNVDDDFILIEGGAFKRRISYL